MNSEREETIIVDRLHSSERLDVWLRHKFPELSRGAIQRLMDEGAITLNGRHVKPALEPKLGDKITIRFPEAKPSEAQAEDIPLEVLYEDDRILVLNKPAGLVVHPAAGHEASTLVNALLYHCEGQLSGIGGVARPGIVHRLDKDTSGCMVVAKTDDAHMALSNQFSGRKVSKIYHAIVCGEVVKASGDIRAAIARNPSERKKMSVQAEGREAHTSYRILEKLNASTLVQATLHTGRTHQIRVHFKFIGFPLVGDHTYGNRQNQHLEDLTNYHPPRQMLHAAHLGFMHPKTGKIMEFNAAIPADFEDALSALRFH